MYKSKFTKWVKWADRNDLKGIENPGVYVCALRSNQSKLFDDFEWVKEIIYVGMTNSIGGLRTRLNQFDNTIAGKTGHGGADRVRYKHRDYQELVNNLHVSVAVFNCDVKSNKPEDLVVMGEVAKFEYVCFAEYVKFHGVLPEFNDKKKAPKYSLTIGRSNGE